MHTHYLAIDIGASSGRHILGWLENGRIRLLEVYRFKNAMVEKNGRLCWDLERLYEEVVTGLRHCADLQITPASVGIDTWGVDYVLLDEFDQMLGDAVAYRDGRTQGMDAEVKKRLSESELYAHTGIQKMQFNTIYQLMAQKLAEPKMLERAASFLMIPEYLNFRLTGAKMNEYTNATTTQLVNAANMTWDRQLMETLGLPTEIFGPLYRPGTFVGYLMPELKNKLGFTTEVVLPATHDTASAVMAVPAEDDDAIYISSGTWSLMGVERSAPDCCEMSRQSNFTNEGGYDYRFRYLKNIMGLWMVQSLRDEFPQKYTFVQMEQMAHLRLDFSSLVDVNDPSFLAPVSMAHAIRAFCLKTEQPIPETESELLACTYRSLADYYAQTANEIDALTEKTHPTIYIIGGGSQDVLLNHLTARASGRTVYAGPAEATAIGNILAQMLRAGLFEDLAQARLAVRESFEVKKV